MVLFCFLLTAYCFAQPFAIERISATSVPYDYYLETDEFGYKYFLKNNVIIKQKDDEVFEYKNISLGKPSRIDLHNPLKIVLFYENFNTIITLDNQLNESNNINLSMYENSILATAVGIASQNRFWIYNSLSQKIGFYDFLNNSYNEITPPLQTSKLAYDTDFNTFFWIDAQRNINSCDIFGKISTLGIVAEFDKIQILDKQTVLILKYNKLFVNNLLNNNIEKIKINEKTIENFYYKNQILTIFTNQELHTYKIKIP